MTDIAGPLSSMGLIDLRPFIQSDYSVLLSWIPMVDAPFLFSGSRVPWPLTEYDPAERARHAETLAWTAVSAANPHKDVGHLEIVHNSSTAGRFSRVLIEPGSRGKRLARKLISAGPDTARAFDLYRVDVNVVIGREPAIRTYSSIGFRKTAVKPEHPSMLQMTLNLDCLRAGSGQYDASHYE
jgi:GNAT superfamily N-acetyltransferase